MKYTKIYISKKIVQKLTKEDKNCSYAVMSVSLIYSTLNACICFTHVHQSVPTPLTTTLIEFFCLILFTVPKNIY